MRITKEAAGKKRKTHCHQETDALFKSVSTPRTF